MDHPLFTHDLPVVGAGVGAFVVGAGVGAFVVGAGVGAFVVVGGAVVVVGGAFVTLKHKKLLKRTKICVQ